MSISCPPDNKLSYLELPEAERYTMQYELYLSAYPNTWVGWNALHKNKRIEQVLSHTYKVLQQFRGKSFTESEMEELYDRLYIAINDALLYGYTKEFKENEIEGGSWSQTVGTAIRSVIDKLCDRLEIIRDY